VFWTPAFAGVTTKKASYDLFKPIGKDPMRHVEAQRSGALNLKNEERPNIIADMNCSELI
jgi:hypothetical protein